MKIKLTKLILSLMLITGGNLVAQETVFFTDFDLGEGFTFLEVSELNDADDQVGTWTGEDFPAGDGSGQYTPDSAGIEANPHGGELLFIDRPIANHTLVANLTETIGTLGASVSFIAGTRRTGGGGAKDYEVFGLDADGNESFRVRIDTQGQRLGYVLGEDSIFDLPTTVGTDMANDIQNTGGPPFGVGDDIVEITVKLSNDGYFMDYVNLNGSNSYTTALLPYNGNAEKISQVGFFYRGVEGATGQQAGFLLDTIRVQGFENLTQGDFNGDGNVDMADFTVMASNFNTQGGPDKGDFNFDGLINLQDFVGLKAAAAVPAAVPEPSSSLLLFVGALFGLAFRRRKAVAVAACVAAMSASASAVDFDSRLIRIDASGANSQINNTVEALSILRGTQNDVVIAEDATGKLDIVDLAGNGGSFSEDRPYPNGVNDNSQSDFLVNVTGIVEIPAGEWSIGMNVDDGSYVRLANIDFEDKFNQNGPEQSADSILLNNTGGFRWSMGQFTLSEPTTTQFQATFFERGGGDGLEVAIADFLVDSNDPTDFELLADGTLGWKVVEITPGDFNFDGSVNRDDFAIMLTNFGTGDEFVEGDMDFSGRTNLSDFVAFRDAFGGAAAAVPEPSSVWMSLIGMLSLALVWRRKR